MPNEQEWPSLEKTLIEFLGSSTKNAPDLRQLLLKSPEVAEQLRQLLAEHDQLSKGRKLSTPDHASRVTPPCSAYVDAPTVASRESENKSNYKATRPTATGNKILGDYELLDEIARGGMGVVYRARQISLDREVALKMILAGQLATKDDVARFYAEAEAAAQLEHPGIVPVFEVGQQDEQHFFAMAYIRGQSLSQRLDDGPITVGEAAKIARQIADAVEYAHEHGVVHRDLKPANVLLDKSGQVKVSDFGLAKRIDKDSHMTMSGQVLGTPGYMPPEQASGALDKVGPVSDVYGVGAVLYAMLVGRPPFQAASPVDTLLQVIERDPIPPGRLNPNVEKDLETICLKCLQKDASERYQTVRQIIDELKRFERGEPLQARPVSSLELLSRWYNRLRHNKVVRVRSHGGIGRIPWVDIAIGPDAETGQSQGVAFGIVAIGNIAWGVVAIGDSARGILTFGETSIGVVSFGTKAYGVVTIGLIGVGFVSFAAVSLGYLAFGALAVGWISIGAVSIATYAFGAIAKGPHALGIGRSDPVALEFFSVWLPNLMERLGEVFSVVMVVWAIFYFLIWRRLKRKATH